MTLEVLGLFALGFLLLLLGAEILVRGASRLAVAVGISPLVVGLTVVAFGTSSPEIAVSLKATWAGEGDIAFGNVVGSNIANILLVLGLSASIAPLVVARSLVRFDVPLMIGASALVVFLAFDGTIGRIDGLVLLAILTWYTVFTIRESRAATKREEERKAAAGEAPEKAPADRGAKAMVLNVLLIVIGFGMLVTGSDQLVDGAVQVAEAMGVSRLVIGLTIVAIGTSLPEVATSAMASMRGERDIAVGNVVGSNMFNLMAVFGVAGTFSPEGIPASDTAMLFDVPVMLGASVACLPIFFCGYVLARWEGLMFLGYYGAYTSYLVLKAQQHAFTDVFRDAMAWFFLPLTVVTIGVVLIRELRHRRAVRASHPPESAVEGASDGPTGH